MFRLGRSVVGCVGFGLLFGACVRSEVTYTGAAKYPARSVGCEIKVFPSTTPDYKWEDLATVEAKCHFTHGRTACVDELKTRVCELGGDTLYGLKDGKSGEYSIVIGTVGHRNDSPLATEAISKTGETPPAVAKSEGEGASAAPAPAASCDPPCSPGYKCSEGQCLALCNPPCGEGMRCNQQRICESASPAPN